jgi:hypothetical protein
MEIADPEKNKNETKFLQVACLLAFCKFLGIF